MNLTKNFSLEEMVFSDIANVKKIANVPDAIQTANLKALCEKVLQPARDKLGKAIHVNSGFRSPVLNIAVNGAKNSQHQLGEAADITMGSKEANKMLFAVIEQLGNYDQLIDEKNYT